MAKRASFWAYLKAAFGWHWNLLSVGAGVAFSLLSGRPDVFLPLLGAAEVAFLGLLSTNPKFRASVDAKLLKDDSETRSQDEQLRQILAVIPKTELRRFESLRRRCHTLNQLGRQYRGGSVQADEQLDSLHTASLDRLLWMFLKMLYSKDALDRFLQNTDRELLVMEIEETEEQLAKAQSGNRGHLARTLEDKLSTMKERLKNYDAAEANRELIEAELGRIEQKVTAVSEMSLSSADPSLLSAQVDGIAESVSITAEAIQSLDVVPDIQYDDVPGLLKVDS